MTDTAKQYPLSDAELLTATGDELYADSWTRNSQSGDAWPHVAGGLAAQRDAIVRACDRAQEAGDA